MKLDVGDTHDTFLFFSLDGAARCSCSAQFDVLVLHCAVKEGILMRPSSCAPPPFPQGVLQDTSHMIESKTRFWTKSCDKLCVSLKWDVKLEITFKTMLGRALPSKLCLACRCQ